MSADDWLNPDVDTHEAHIAFRDHGVANLRGILKQDRARQLLAFLDVEMPASSWLHSTHADFSNGLAVKHVPVLPENAETIFLHRAAAERLKGTNVVAYAFQRTMQGPGACLHPELEDVWTLMGSRRLLDLVQEIVGYPLQGVETLFASRYVKGDFLDYHTDAAEGRPLAFVLNLSRDWSEHDGGNLVIEHGRGGQRELRTLKPEWNSLTLFDVAGAGRGHHVSTVMHPEKRRVAVSGWLR